MVPKASNQIGYTRQMQKSPVSGFKRKYKSAVVTITNTATGVMATMLEDGRTA
jgi:hypothetical protein